MARQDPPPPERDPFLYVNLRRARLCLDCEAIFEGPQCPGCTSESYIPVSRWIRPSDLVAVESRPAPALPPAKSRGILKKSLYLGLGAYGVWKMLFEPPKPRKRKAAKEPAGIPDSGGEPPGSPG